MGGAVSYAWHGLIPYPPDPWAYVLYRVEDAKVEHLFLDWAHPRAIEVKRPAWEELLRGDVRLEGAVGDLDHTLQRVTCRVADQEAEAKLAPAGQMKKSFRAELDLGALTDGVYDLVFTVADEQGTEEQQRPILVLNDKPEPYQAGETAKLHLQVSKSPQHSAEVLVNGQSVGTITPAEKSRALSFPLQPDMLRRLNSIAVRLAEGDQGEFSNLHIAVGGATRRDVRFAPRRPLRLKAARDGLASTTFYVDLTYQGPRGR
jgi:hypothetical protein